MSLDGVAADKEEEVLDRWGVVEGLGFSCLGSFSNLSVVSYMSLRATVRERDSG